MYLILFQDLEVCNMAPWKYCLTQLPDDLNTPNRIIWLNTPGLTMAGFQLALELNKYFLIVGLNQSSPKFYSDHQGNLKLEPQSSKWYSLQF